MQALIKGKRENHYAPSLRDVTLGFRGWHERGYLPHFDAPNLTQLVTFNLADSFPVERRAEWEIFLQLPEIDLRRRRLEDWLDRGCGSCWLGLAKIAAITEASLLDGHDRDYFLQAWVIMPNHVHIVVDVWTTPLSRLVKAWKGSSAAKSNRVLGRTGSFWQGDYWDTWIRDAKHLAVAVKYVENNPAKARLIKNPKEWLWGSARRRSESGVLDLNAE